GHAALADAVGLSETGQDAEGPGRPTSFLKLPMLSASFIYVTDAGLKESAPRKSLRGNDHENEGRETAGRAGRGAARAGPGAGARDVPLAAGIGGIVPPPPAGAPALPLQPT